MNKKFTEAFKMLALIAILTVIVLMVATMAQGQVVMNGYRYRTDGTYLSVNGGCSCQMCNMARQYNYQVSQQIQAAHQQQVLSQQRRLAETASTPASAVRQVLSLLKLDESSTLLEVGCGDGKILIEAVRKYGCRGISVEIDTELANRAALNVRNAGLPITIYHGDVREFRGFAGTVAYAYLFPDLLGDLEPQLRTCLRVVTYMHAVPGLEGKKRLAKVDGQYMPVYVWEAPKVALPLTVPRLRES